MGTTVHAQAYGGGYAASILDPLKRFDFSKINPRSCWLVEGPMRWPRHDLYSYVSHFISETYGVNLISTDGLSRSMISTVVDHGLMGFRLATVVNAVTTQWPALNSTYTESMHLVSVAPAGSRTNYDSL